MYWTINQATTSIEPILPRTHTKTRRWANPKSWDWKAWCIVVSISLALLAGLIVAAILSARALAYPDYYPIKYQVAETYSAKKFFDNFDFFTGWDPTHGFVHYVDAESAMHQNLTAYSRTIMSAHSERSSLGRQSAILRVDTSDKNATTGRRSVRISSKKSYNSGLFLFDVVHSPYGCATWPALWLVGPEWPSTGEIDIMEAVNMGDTGNHVTLHTSEGCRIGKNRRRKQTGKALTYDCWNAANSNSGCGVEGPPETFGEAFNAKGGGIYAVELRKEGIRVWFFDRETVPNDIVFARPDPSTWHTPLADFPNLACDVKKHFRELKIVVNIDLCGDWAGEPHVFAANEQCTGWCSDWVATQAESFEEAYWEFNGFWVFDAVE